MQFRKFGLSCLMLVLFFAGCASAEEPPPPAQAQLQAPPQTQPEAAAQAGADALTGMWAGDWGPNARDRNQVTLELKWDGTSLTGTVNPGPDAVSLLQQSRFNPATGEVHMEAEAQGRGGTIHYIIDGKVEGNMMTGSWNHPNGMGDFKITRQ